MRTIQRGAATYYRVCDPLWADCCDTTWSAKYGGRWNAPESFPALYLNADVDTAKANAARIYEGEAFGLFDLNPTARPHLQLVDVPRCKPVDAVTNDGLAELGLPSTYPNGIGYAACQPIGQTVHDAGACGIACRSAARPTGEELALFDFGIAAKRTRLAFDDWFGATTNDL